MMSAAVKPEPMTRRGAPLSLGWEGGGRFFRGRRRGRAAIRDEKVPEARTRWVQVMEWEAMWKPPCGVREIPERVRPVKRVSLIPTALGYAAR